MKTIQKMKEVIIAVALVLVMNLSFDSCIATRDTTKINKVEIGMTKSDVKKTVGYPAVQERQRRSRGMGLPQVGW